MKSIKHVLIHRYSDDSFNTKDDILAIEDPLEIALVFENNIASRKPISITMRTPGNDEELSLGFLFTESIIDKNSDITKLIQVNDNSIDVYLSPEIKIDLNKLNRHFYTSSSCGVCGKSSLDAIRTINSDRINDYDFTISKTLLFDLNNRVKTQQTVFQSTGGLHASALFDAQGNIIALREDVGRHNALDKIIGMGFLAGDLPLEKSVLFLSGRASFELIQKAIIGGIKVICALGAPSSLAVELAEEYNITLVGFLKPNSFNIYSANHRIF
jgi:FdhD protein